MNAAIAMEPSALIAASGSLSPASPCPPRVETLFESACVVLMLARLKRGQKIFQRHGRDCLLEMVEGQARLHGPNGSCILNEGGRWRLGRGEAWKIRANTDAWVLLMIAK